MVELSADLPLPSLLPEGVKFELHTLPVDEKAVPDGDGMTVYVSTADPRESSLVPREVQVAAVKRSRARAQKDYTRADAFHKKIIDQNYRVIHIQNEEVLARKYRIRLRYEIDNDQIHYMQCNAIFHFLKSMKRVQRNRCTRV